MLEELKKQVLEANLLLKSYGLIMFTWGNASGIDRKSGIIAIKPSGIPYEEMGIDDIVLIDMDGNHVEGSRKPSSDTPTHLELYKAFPECGAVVHTHSKWATCFAQAGMEIPALGTTQGDYFYGAIPCTRPMTYEEINGEYERETGKVIVETFSRKDPASIPGVLVHSHGPFSWGKNVFEAAQNAAIMEQTAFMAWHTIILNPNIGSMPQPLLDKHYNRKHGVNAYYGQK